MQPMSTMPMMPMSNRHLSQIVPALLALIAAAVANATPLAAQTLRGSKASVATMYDFAESHHYDFYGTDGAIEAAVARRKLVPLTGNMSYTTTSAVGWSYARPETKQFIEAFAPRYLQACGAPLMVTSAARPVNQQPRNANPHSVHPTGMAFDIRRPPRGSCLRWLRAALVQLEKQGFIEATEEHHPVHLHVAVLTPPGRVAVLPPLPAPPAGVLANLARVLDVAAGEVVPSPADSARSYRVRGGDTLWDIAHRLHVRVRTLAAFNHLGSGSQLRPGMVLRVPKSASGR